MSQLYVMAGEFAREYFSQDADREFVNDANQHYHENRTLDLALERARERLFAEIVEEPTLVHV